MKWVFLILLVADMVVLRNVFAPKVLEVTFLSVGDGDAILIKAPNGTTVLIDAGPDASILRALGSALPFWKRSLDAVVETNSAASSVGGVPDVLGRYKVGKVFKAESLHRGMRFVLGSGAYMDTLLPSGEGSAAAFRLVYGSTAFFISGDLSESDRERLAILDAEDGELRANVFFVPHEGAKDSVTSAWLSVLHPTVAVISVGAQNKYGYPATTTLEALKSAGIKTNGTDEVGAVSFTSNGREVR